MRRWSKWPHLSGRRAGVPRSEANDQGCPGRLLRRGGGQLELTAEHRVDDDPVNVKVDQQELAALPDLQYALSDQADQVRRCPAHREGGRRVCGLDAPPGRCRMEGLGDDGQIGEFGVGSAIVAGRTPVLDSPGPSGRIAQEQVRPGFESMEGTAAQPTTDHPIILDEGLSPAPAVLDSRG